MASVLSTLLLDESPVNVIKVIKRVFYKMKWEYISFPTSAGQIKFILPGCWSVKYHESTKEIAQNYCNQCSQLLVERDGEIVQVN